MFVDVKNQSLRNIKKPKQKNIMNNNTTYQITYLHLFVNLALSVSIPNFNINNCVTFENQYQM